MGRRRLRDVTYLCPGDVSLFEPDAARCKEVSEKFGVRGFSRFEEAIAQKPEAIVVSTPPALHEPYVRQAVQRGIHVFCELPFVLDAGAMSEIIAQAEKTGVILGVSGTIRFYPPYGVIRKLLRDGRIGKPYYLEYSLGNHIADWHPYEDYRKFYASDAKLGGAGMDMILHELAPIQWWLGNIVSVAARLTKVSDLEINGPDNHDMLLTFAGGGRGFFHHDILERGTIGRHIRITGETGTIEWHQNQPAIRLFSENRNQEIAFDQAPDWEDALKASSEHRAIIAKQSSQSGTIPSAASASYTYESNYLREMRHFIEAAAGRHPYTTATPQEDLQTLRVFHAVIESSKTFSEVRVEN